MAGAILGHRGQIIHRISAESQAFVSMGGENDMNERVIYIRGVPEAVKKAKCLLKQAVREKIGERENFGISKCFKVGHFARECHEEEDKG